MLEKLRSNSFSCLLHKNEQSKEVLREELPARAMSLPILKAIEQRLVERGLINRHANCYPLWFLAETERNVFLWRHGLSIREQARFEFWVDIEALARKRLASLSRSCTAGEAACEEAYLKRLCGYLLKIDTHAHALSRVGLIVEKEITPNTLKTVVLLPPPARGTAP